MGKYHAPKSNGEHREEGKGALKGDATYRKELKRKKSQFYPFQFFLVLPFSAALCCTWLR